ncbi:hypothetical protein SE17_07685 [Kouleothrix aurantiaca]|uniref:Uncharacterized protein n=1 Tax=Kouleothrix aurantiaca TaxID=186479 RepID=A0A0P9D7E1_9CHLR|nr:hypothetical protein SE17_07685 [Kouleothrix aurantiaca]
MAAGNLYKLTVQLEERHAYERLAIAPVTATFPTDVIIVTAGRIKIFLVVHGNAVEQFSEEVFLQRYSWEPIPPQ